MSETRAGFGQVTAPGYLGAVMRLSGLVALMLCAGCAARAPMSLYPTMPASRLHEALSHLEPGAPVRLHVDSLGRIEGRFVAAWNNTIAIAQRPGEVLEVTGFDTLWVHRDQVPLVRTVLLGALTGQAMGMLISRNGKFESVHASRLRLAGAAAGALTAHVFRDGWSRAYSSRVSSGGRDSIVRRMPPVTALRSALAAVPLGTSVRVFIPSGIVEGRYAGIWGDSLRFADRPVAVAPDEVLDVWWRPIGSSTASGAALGGLAGVVVGTIAGALLLNDYPQPGAAAGIIVGGFTIGAFIGGIAGSRDSRWIRWR